MPDVIYPVMRYTVFNFSQLSGATEEVIVADRIPIAPYAMIGLSLRQHRKNIAASGSFTFILRSINPSDEDGADFVHATNIASTTAITGTGGAALLEFSVGIATNRSHPFGRLVLSAVGPSPVGFTYGIFSGELILRTDT